MKATNQRASNLTSLGLGLIVFLTTTVGAFIPLIYSGIAKKADWARQDLVASRVAEAAKQTAEAARLLLQRQELESLKTAEAARLLLAANERVAKNAGDINGKLDVIHDLVNSKMTESMQNELDSEIKGLALMKEVMALKEAAKLQPSPEALGVIKKTEEKISELRARLGDRLKQQEAIDAKKKPPAFPK